MASITFPFHSPPNQLKEVSLKKFKQTTTATLSKLWLNLWKKIEEFAKKLDKMWIRDRGTVKKDSKNYKKVLVLSNIRWNFEKKN